MNVAESMTPRIVSVDEARDKFLNIRERLSRISEKINDIKYGAIPKTAEVSKSIPMGYEGIVELSRVITAQVAAIESDLDPLQPNAKDSLR